MSVFCSHLTNISVDVDLGVNMCILVAWHIPALTEFMCERDELADVVEDLKHGSVIGSHWRSLTLYKKSFSGEQLLDWLQKKKGMGK